MSHLWHWLALFGIGALAAIARTIFGRDDEEDDT